MDHDGTKQGFALEALKTLNDTLTIPIIASGGAGNQGHFVSLFQETDVSAGLAASIFHYQEVRIPDLKKDLANVGIVVRL
jgi:cyclase